VFVDRGPIGLAADTFTENDELGAHLATSHLIGHGHRRIAYLGDVVHLSTETNRFEGWRRAQREAGIEVDDDLVALLVSDRDAAAAALARLAALPDPPTALFSANARTSMALVAGLRDEPMAMVGFGDFPMADILTPSVTVIDQNPYRLGTLAAERIFARLASGEGPDPATVLDVSLVERESCRIPPR